MFGAVLFPNTTRTNARAAAQAFCKRVPSGLPPLLGTRLGARAAVAPVGIVTAVHDPSKPQPKGERSRDGSRQQSATRVGASLQWCPRVDSPTAAPPAPRAAGLLGSILCNGLCRLACRFVFSRGRRVKTCNNVCGLASFLCG